LAQTEKAQEVQGRTVLRAMSECDESELDTMPAKRENIVALGEAAEAVEPTTESNVIVTVAPESGIAAPVEAGADEAGGAAPAAKVEAKPSDGAPTRTASDGSDAPCRADSLMSKQATMVDATKEERHEMSMDLGKEAGTYHPMHILPTSGRTLGELEAFVDMKAHFKTLVTPMRFGVVVFFIVLTLLGVFLMDPEEFKIQKTVPNVKDFAACATICRKTLIDDAFATKLGGKGICGPVGELVDFRYCQMSSKLKQKGCKKFSSDVAVAAAGFEYDATRCRFDVAPSVWKPYITLAVLAVAIVCCFQNGPPDVLLMGGGGILCALGVMDRKEFFGGLANSGVIGLAMLMPIAAAISESGILEKAVGIMLGNPKSLGVAILRMMFPVALMSAILSNTATVAMLIPIIVSWARRLEVHPGQMLMPLSFAAQLGGSMTVLGSSHCLVAANAIPSELYEMGFFDLAPIGTLIMIVTTFIIWGVVTKTSLLVSSAQGAEAPPVDIKYVYDFQVKVAGGGMVNSTIADSGLERLPGILSVKHSSGDSATALKFNDVLNVECNAKGIVQLRASPGLELMNQRDLSALGRARHRRFLYEVDIHPESEIASHGLPTAEEMQSIYGACFVAGPRRSVDETKQELKDITGGSVLLLEADERSMGALKLEEWTLGFTLVHRVHRSSPQRHGLPVDKIRSIATFLGFVVLIACTTLKVVKFDYGGVLLVLFYLAIRAITLDQCMASFKVQILMTIVGALAMGTAMERSGVVNFLAQKMIQLAEPLGTFGLTFCVYVAAVFLSMFINNSATVAILSPMIKQIAEKDETVAIQGLVWTLVYAAGTCFTTPLGYQTNLMVMPEGKYTFGDFMRFGLPTQILHFGLVLVLILVLGPLLYPAFGG